MRSIRAGAILLVMPVVENIDGTLWIDIYEMTDVDDVQAKLLSLGVRVAAVIPDPGCDVASPGFMRPGVYTRASACRAR